MLLIPETVRASGALSTHTVAGYKGCAGDTEQRDVCCVQVHLNTEQRMVLMGRMEDAKLMSDDLGSTNLYAKAEIESKLTALGCTVLGERLVAGLKLQAVCSCI